MLTRYVQCMEADRSIDKIMLLSKEYLLQFYMSCGFSVVSRSRVQHGQERWYEMQMDLMQRRSAEQLQIDAFAAEAFSGNPAAVVFEHRDEVWMQKVAMENNLAETSFITPMEPDGASAEASYRLRWSVSSTAFRKTDIAINQVLHVIGSLRPGRWSCAVTRHWPQPTPCTQLTGCLH